MSGELHGANRIMDCSLCWGAFPEMTEDEIDYVVSAVQRYSAANRREIGCNGIGHRAATKTPCEELRRH